MDGSMSSLWLPIFFEINIGSTTTNILNFLLFVKVTVNPILGLPTGYATTGLFNISCALPVSRTLPLSSCGVLCGAEGWVEIEEFGKTKEAWFTELLDLPNGIPSHDTFGRVFALIDPKQFEASFMQWVQGISKTVKGVVIIEQEGAYALALKDNQGNLYDEVKATFALAEKDGFANPPWESDRQVEIGGVTPYQLKPLAPGNLVTGWRPCQASQSRLGYLLSLARS
jgi:hypothetical protein